MKEGSKKTAKKKDDRIRLFVFGKKMDWGLLAVIFVLLTVGLIMILSASAPFALRTEGDSYYYFEKQLLFAGIGIVVMFIVSKIDYRIYNSRLSYLAYLRRLTDLCL